MKVEIKDGVLKITAKNYKEDELMMNWFRENSKYQIKEKIHFQRNTTN